MLLSAFPKLNGLKCTQGLRAFFRSFLWPLFIALLMAVSEIFGLEIPVYFTYLACGTVCVLFTDDTLPLLPFVCCIYMSFSKRSVIGDFAAVGFQDPANLVKMLFIFIAAAVLVTGKVIVCLTGAKKRRLPKLLFGFLGLGAAYLLAGAFSPYYGGRTVLYGFTQIVCLLTFYIFFYYTVDWEHADKDYIFTVFLCVGVGMLAEIIGMYFSEGVVIDGGVDRGELTVGWGVYNYVASIMAMCIFAPFYFAATKKFGFLFALLGCVFYLGVVLTQSRGGILFGTVVFLLCAVAAFVKAGKRAKIGIGIVYGVFFIAAVIACTAFKPWLDALFRSLIESGSNDAGRFWIYRESWKVFCGNPLFGRGWYGVPGALLTGGVGPFPVTETPPGPFIPARAHDTYLELLASGGVVSFLAYAAHRAQTLVLLFRAPTFRKTMIALSVGALVFTSILDNNFFNLGTGLMYGCLLAAAEGSQWERMIRHAKK